jgi:hypothetical protein
MPNNGTIAVWCVPRVGSSPTEIEAHFNYWRLAGDKAFKRKSPKPVVDFVEVGVLVTNIEQVESISIYVPVAVSRGRVADCAPYLANAEFAQGIFNEVLAVTTPAAGGPHCVVLLSQNRDIFCRVHTFPVGQNGIEPSELEIAAQNEGSVLTITAAAIREACLHLAPPAPVYFRLRLYLKEGRDENPFVKVILPRDRLFQSGFDEIEYIDFRMNEARTLPIPIEHRMRLDRSRGAPIAFRLVAFLTAVPVHSELSVSNTPSHKMRLLERSWNGYVESGIPEGMVVYHWKRVPEPAKPITDFSAFVKLQTRRSSVPILLKYLAIAFVFGLAGNLTASWLSGVWQRAFSRKPAAVAQPAVKPAPPTPAPVPTALKPPPASPTSEKSVG